jgi:hypothetical protein
MGGITVSGSSGTSVRGQQKRTRTGTKYPHSIPVPRFSRFENLDDKGPAGQAGRGIDGVRRDSGCRGILSAGLANFFVD